MKAPESGTALAPGGCFKSYGGMYDLAIVTSFYVFSFFT